MNRNDLITALASNTGLAKRDAERALDGILAAITEALKRGGDVRLTGFGTFTVRHRAATQARNPSDRRVNSKSPVVGNRSSRRARA